MKRGKRSKQKKLTPIDYLRIGRAIGRLGYCGECIGCLCYRDFCDWAMELKDAEAKKELRGPRFMGIEGATFEDVWSDVDAPQKGHR